jgi:hypothetical protein
MICCGSVMLALMAASTRLALPSSALVMSAFVTRTMRPTCWSL